MPACVTGAVGATRHRRGLRATPSRRGVGPIKSVDRPRQPLWDKEQGWGGGRRLQPAPGQGAGPDPPPLGYRGTGKDATSRDEGPVWRSGVPELERAFPLSCGQHTPGAAPKSPDPGQHGNDLSGSRRVAI